MWQRRALTNLGFPERAFESLPTACPSDEKLPPYWEKLGAALKTASHSPPPAFFSFLQLKIGILIAQPQILIHEAQKGRGLLISSDY